MMITGKQIIIMIYLIIAVIFGKYAHHKMKNDFKRWERYPKMMAIFVGLGWPMSLPLMVIEEIIKFFKSE